MCDETVSRLRLKKNTHGRQSAVRNEITYLQVTILGRRMGNSVIDERMIQLQPCTMDTYLPRRSFLSEARLVFGFYPKQQSNRKTHLKGGMIVPYVLLRKVTGGDGD